MQRELDQVQSEAYKTAQEIKGKADAKAIKIYANAYNKDPGFYEFLKTLETYESTIDKKNTLIMTTDSDYFKYFKNIEQNSKMCEKFSNEYWMNFALKEARLVLLEDEVPIGAILVKDNKIIAAEHNRTGQLNSGLAHAENW